MAHRQRAEEGRVDEREDGGVGANPQRQREHHDRRKAWVAAKGAKSVAQVLAELVEYVGGTDGSPSLMAIEIDTARGDIVRCVTEGVR